MATKKSKEILYLVDSGGQTHVGPYTYEQLRENLIEWDKEYDTQHFDIYVVSEGPLKPILSVDLLFE